MGHEPCISIPFHALHPSAGRGPPLYPSDRATAVLDSGRHVGACAPGVQPGSAVSARAGASGARAASHRARTPGQRRTGSTARRDASRGTTGPGAAPSKSEAAGSAARPTSGRERPTFGRQRPSFGRQRAAWDTGGTRTERPEFTEFAGVERPPRHFPAAEPAPGAWPEGARPATRTATGFVRGPVQPGARRASSQDQRERDRGEARGQRAGSAE